DADDRQAAAFDPRLFRVSATPCRPRSARPRGAGAGGAQGHAARLLVALHVRQPRLLEPPDLGERLGELALDVAHVALGERVADHAEHRARDELRARAIELELRRDALEEVVALVRLGRLVARGQARLE